MSSRGPTREEFLASELQRLEAAYNGDYYPALIEAFKLCALNDWPMPYWVWHRMAFEQEASLAGIAFGGTRGRTGGRFASADMDHIHCLRWSWAKHWLVNRKTLPMFPPKGVYAPTREGAFAYTSYTLRGTKAQGEPGAIENSYKKVERAFKAGGGDRYLAAADDLRWDNRRKAG